MSITSKFKRFFELDDQDSSSQAPSNYEAEKELTSPTRYKEKEKTIEKQNVVSIQSVQKSAKVIIVEPRAYDEVQDIADYLKERKAVVINLHRIGNEQGKRVVDFLSGTVYAIGGDIQKLGANIFLCTPDNVDVTGAISEIISE